MLDDWNPISKLICAFGVLLILVLWLTGENGNNQAPVNVAASNPASSKLEHDTLIRDNTPLLRDQPSPDGSNPTLLTEGYKQTGVEEMPPASTFKEIVDRPLFSPTRQPASLIREEEPLVEEEYIHTIDETPILNIRMVGSVNMGDEYKALLTSNNYETIYAGFGDEVDGWVVTYVDNMSVVVEFEEERRELRLFNQE